MTAAIVISALTVLAGVTTLVVKFDKEGPEMFKKKDKDNKEE